MSIATEITRLQNAKASIKSSIEAKGVSVPSSTTLDGYSTLIDSIPSGGGATINGQLVSKTIQSGSVTKGDFVKRGNYNIEDKVSSSAQMSFGTNASVSSENNLYDNDDNTYANVKANASSTLNVSASCKSREQLNIPATAILKGISYTTKFRFANQNGNIGNLIKLPSNSATYLEAPAVTQDTNINVYTSNYTALSDLWDTNQYRVRFFNAQAGSNVNLYYIRFNITYEYAR